MPGYLIRHGSTEHNEQGLTRGVTNVKLSDDGIRQAQSIAHVMQMQPITSLRSSDLDRASHTAAIIGQAVGKQPQLSPRLRPIDLGAHTGVPTDSVKDAIAHHVTEAPEKRFPGGQSYQDWLYQSWPEVRNFLLDVRKGKSPAMVIHGTMANMFHALIDGKGKKLSKAILKDQPKQKPGEIWTVSHDGSAFSYDGPINRVETPSAGAGS